MEEFRFEKSQIKFKYFLEKGQSLSNYKAQDIAFLDQKGDRISIKKIISSLKKTEKNIMEYIEEYSVKVSGKKERVEGIDSRKRSVVTKCIEYLETIDGLKASFEILWNILPKLRINFNTSDMDSLCLKVITELKKFCGVQERELGMCFEVKQRQVSSKLKILSNKVTCKGGLLSIKYHFSKKLQILDLLKKNGVF